MAQNYNSPGNVIQYLVPAETEIESGDPIMIGDLPAVALQSGVTGDTISAQLDGVFALPKGAGTINNGTRVYLAEGLITATAEGNDPFGHSVETTDATVILIKLQAGMSAVAGGG